MKHNFSNRYYGITFLTPATDPGCSGQSPCASRVLVLSETGDDVGASVRRYIHAGLGAFANADCHTQASPLIDNIDFSLIKHFAVRAHFKSDLA